jgi:hypothetical protein
MPGRGRRTGGSQLSLPPGRGVRGIPLACTLSFVR